MEKILVPTDFSDFADAAKDYAVALAKKTGAELHFEHTMLVAVDWENLSESDRLLYPELKKTIEEAEKKLKDLVEEVQKAGVKAQDRLTFNEGLIDIPGDIQANGYDMAVIGSHGATGLKSVLLGSNAQRMIRHAPCPVLIVKNKEEKPAFNRITFASNFENNHQKGFEKIAEFTRNVNGLMRLLYVNTPVNFETSDESKAKLEAFHEKHPDVIDQFEVFNHYTEDEGILKYMENNSDSDVLAIATHGRKGWTRVFSGSITESLVAHGDFPVLSVNLNT